MTSIRFGERVSISWPFISPIIGVCRSRPLRASCNGTGSVSIDDECHDMALKRWTLRKRGTNEGESDCDPDKE